MPLLMVVITESARPWLLGVTGSIASVTLALSLMFRKLDR
jgi:hypothetical protein